MCVCVRAMQLNVYLNKVEPTEGVELGKECAEVRVGGLLSGAHTERTRKGGVSRK